MNDLLKQDLINKLRKPDNQALIPESDNPTAREQNINNRIDHLDSLVDELLLHKPINQVNDLELARLVRLVNVWIEKHTDHNEVADELKRRYDKYYG